MPRLRRIAAVFSVALAAQVLAAADAAPVSPATANAAPLSLADAIDEGERNGTTAAQAVARLERIASLQTQARSLLMPNATIVGSYGATWERRRPYAGRSVDGVQGEGAVEMRLLNFTAFPALDSAKLQYAAQQQISAGQRRAAAYGVASAYLTVLAAERQRTVASKRLEVSNQFLDEAKARLRAGLAIASDVTRVEVEVADARLGIIQAERAITVGRLALQESMGGREPGVLADPSIAVPEGAADQLIEQALTRRDDAQAARIGEQVNRAEGTRVQRDNWPVIGARAGVRDQDFNDSRIPDGDPQWFAALTLSWSLYDGGLRGGRLEENAANGRELAAQTRAVTLGIQREIRQAVSDLELNTTAIALAEAKSRSAQADATDAQARYRAGTGTATELADAQLRAATADADLEGRRIDLLSAQLRVRQVVGRWPLRDTDTP